MKSKLVYVCATSNSESDSERFAPISELGLSILLTKYELHWIEKQSISPI